MTPDERACAAHAVRTIGRLRADLLRLMADEGARPAFDAVPAARPALDAALNHLADLEAAVSGSL
jgi:hypothetical protein